MAANHASGGNIPITHGQSTEEHHQKEISCACPPRFAPFGNIHVGKPEVGIGGWSVLAALIALHRWFTAPSVSPDDDGMLPQPRPLLTYDQNADARTHVDRDALLPEMQQLCSGGGGGGSNETHAVSCPLWAKIEELSGIIKSKEAEMNQKEQEVSIAQSKVEQLVKDKEQQTTELMHWTQIAINFEKECKEMHYNIPSEAKNQGKSNTDPNNLAEIAALSQELEKRKEGLKVKEEEITSELGEYKRQIDGLRQENEKHLQRFNCTYSYKSTCQYYEEEWRKREAQLGVHIKKMSQENERLQKLLQNWQESAKYYEHEYKKLWTATKDRPGYPQLQAHQQGASTSNIRHQQQQQALCRQQAPHNTSASQVQYQKALARQHEEELATLRKQVMDYEKRYKELQNRMQMAERMVAQHALVDTALYQDDEATPALLQAKVDAVKNAISMCASNILKFSDKHFLSINPNSHFITTSSQLGHHLDLKGQNRKQVGKMALQAFLCEFLFHSFESATYSSKSHSNVPFEKPQAHRKQRLELFRKLRDLEPAEICKENGEFRRFVEERGMLVVEKLHVELLCHKGDLTPGAGEALQVNVVQKLVVDHLDQLSSPFHTSFLRLAKAVWLLHEVAFACEPASAEIFRVAPNSSFMEEYMKEHEDTQSKRVTNAVEEEKDQRRLVAFMNVPGFTLRNSIIKSVVCCFDSLAPT